MCSIYSAHSNGRTRSLLKNAVLTFFNFASWEAKLPMAHEITTRVVILPSRPCDVAARRILKQAASAAATRLAVVGNTFARVLSGLNR